MKAKVRVKYTILGNSVQKVVVSAYVWEQTEKNCDFSYIDVSKEGNTDTAIAACCKARMILLSRLTKIQLPPKTSVRLS